jgi:hypothetical protein
MVPWPLTALSALSGHLWFGETSSRVETIESHLWSRMAAGVVSTYGATDSCTARASDRSCPNEHWRHPYR